MFDNNNKVLIKYIMRIVNKLIFHMHYEIPKIKIEMFVYTIA